ncbi:hypothetical protein K450DRAFT_244953 [Umbelopsis ramanniana AG]|uniref:Cyclin-like domain-containing protein n=1 Tax=Umbelopsis ramanniana AG TaxID=1314678 RepID=A0AAD5HCA6_UMBRA|nr:uncharacterized protein K450DRAFT_244953 [Umbelopsis ramanniana AG]KAI8578882.1 hypothetical protein K450DRAFT_244953 [Umbelopsis ramanniana AG]
MASPSEVSQQQWYYRKEALSNTPSITIDGFSVKKEKEDRAKGCNFIQSVGMTLKLPQITIATAMVFFHRFFMRKSLKDYPFYDIAATAIFLATKVEESGRKLRDIVTVCAQKAAKNEKLVLDEQSKDFQRWRDIILYDEGVLLEAICFDLTIEHPYHYLLLYIHELRESNRLAQTAWMFVNDSIKSPLCLLYTPQIIAGASIYLASKLIAHELTADEDSEWWELVSTKLDEIEDAVFDMLDLYSSSTAVSSSKGRSSSGQDHKPASEYRPNTPQPNTPGHNNNQDSNINTSSFTPIPPKLTTNGSSGSYEPIAVDSQK